MSRKNKLVVPEAKQALDSLKMEIAEELGYSPINGSKSAMYPAIVNGLSVRQMVRMGEQMLVNKSRMLSDRDIF